MPARTVGDGDTVTDQTPAGGAIVPNNASIILYLGAEKPDTPCTVPNVVGKTAAEANKALTNAGLIMKVTGATTIQLRKCPRHHPGSSPPERRWRQAPWSPFSLATTRVLD